MVPRWLALTNVPNLADQFKTWFGLDGGRRYSSWARNRGTGKAAEVATYIVEQGKPPVVPANSP